MKLPLQTGATMLRRLLLTTLLGLMLAIGFAVSEPPTGAGWKPLRGGVFAIEWLLCCPITAVLLVQLAGRSRASDCELGPATLRVTGGKYDQLEVRYGDLRLEGTSLYGGRLVLDLGDAVTVPLATAGVASEVRSLEALLATLVAHRRQLALGATVEASEVPSPELLCCPQCGAPAAPTGAPSVVCASCRGTVAVPSSLRAKLHAGRSQDQVTREVSELLERVKRQPSAKRVNAMLVVVATLGVIWLPIPALLGMKTVTIATVGLLSLAYWYAFLLIANRRAFALLLTDFGARTVRGQHHCANCGAPLPLDDAAGPVRSCVYCDAVSILGFDWGPVHRRLEGASESLAAALDGHRAALRRARWTGALGLGVCTVVVAFSGRAAQQAETEALEGANRHELSCYGSVCHLVKLDDLAKRRLLRLGADGDPIALVVDEGGEFADLAQVPPTVHVRAVWVTAPKGTLDLASLRGFADLEELSISPGATVRSVEELVKLPLRKLTLYGASSASWAALGALTELTELSLVDSDFTDLRLLRPLTKLQSLRLSGAKVSTLAGLELLPQLRSFACDHCPLTDYSALAKVSQLTSVSLNGTGLRDLRVLVDLRELTYFYGSENPLTDLSTLATLPSLRVVWLEGVPLTSVAPLTRLPRLASLRLDVSKLTDPTELQRIPALAQLCIQESATEAEEASLRALLPNAKVWRAPCVRVSDVAAGVNDIQLNSH